MRAVPPLPDSRPVKRLACVSAIVAAAAGSIHAFVPSALAPRINVRWVPSLPSTERENAERALGLREGERMDGSTWSYDLTSPSQATIETLITHPALNSYYNLTRDERYELGIIDELVRLSVGLEDPRDIISDLELGFANMQ